MQDRFTVFLIDDDPGVRDAIALLLAVNGYRTQVFADAVTFLRAFDPTWRGCLLLDVRMPGLSGLDLQARLRDRGIELPVIIITGHGDVETARLAFRAAATDFLEKPIDETRLLAAVSEALAGAETSERNDAQKHAYAEKRRLLTAREQEVLQLIVDGRPNRDIAALLGISARTVEVHKARIMEKLGAHSLAELMRMTLS